MGYSPQKASAVSAFVRCRVSYLTALCVCIFVLVLASLFTFQLSALSASGWSFYLHSAPLVSDLDLKVLDNCYVTNSSNVNNTLLKLTTKDASCTREKVLIKLKMEVNDLPRPLVQKLANKTKILDPEAFGGERNDETNKRLQGKFDDLQRKVNGLITFLPIRDVNYNRPPEEAQSFFMSSFDQTMQDENGLLYFPSEASKGRILCVKGNDTQDGSTRNSYALAWKDYLPPNFTLLHGMTYVTRQYHYFNIYHSLIALGPFLYWYKHHEFDKPERLVLYGSGEIKVAMGPWITELVQAGIGYKVPIDTLQGYGSGPVCFEKSVVNRHGYSRFTKESGHQLFNIVREKARQFCNVSKLEALPERLENLTSFNVTLLTREGNRSFKNESVVASILKKECDKVPGCRFRIFRADDLTFCGQVQALSSTQVLVSVHGAQNTNLVFMNRGSHVMEMFPKGWKEFGGSGQFVYHWLADYSGMKHEGDWRDKEKAECPNPEKGQFHCFMFFKNQRVGYNETRISMWVKEVLNRVGVSTQTA